MNSLRVNLCFFGKERGDYPTCDVKRVFNVEVELRESDPERLREGFRATVEFPIETIPNVIIIPTHAVDFRHGVATVRVRINANARPRTVRLGPESNGKVVVREGLGEGEVVWVPPAPSKAEEGKPGSGEGAQPSGKTGPKGSSGTRPAARTRARGTQGGKPTHRKKRSGSGK